MYGMLLILILALMGGAIAFIGDRLGTKVGKKKISLFGLRPRHTSMVMTVITGIFIVTSTLGVMAVTSQDVRTALFGMEKLKAELAALNLEAQAKNAELDKARAALNEKNQEIATLDKSIAETQARLASVTGELQAVLLERDRIQQDLAEATERYETAQAKLAEAEAAVSKLESSKQALEQDLARLHEITDQLRRGLTNVREGQVIYQAGEVIGRAVLKGGKPLEESRQELNAFLQLTNSGIIERLRVQDEQLMILWIAQADYDQAAATLAEAKVDQAVRIVASGNIVYGEPVIAQLELHPNYLIYGKGALLYEERFASLSTQEAEGAIMSVLAKVNQQAARDGLLVDPLAGTVGSLKAAEVFEAVQAVRQEKGAVRVAVYAKKDIYTVGPIEIVIKVSSAL